MAESVLSDVNLNLTGALSYVPYLMWGIGITLVLVLVYRMYKNKQIFVFPVRIYQRRENGKVREKNAVGGFMLDKDKVPFFRIKLSRFKPWMKVDLRHLPDAHMMDEENRVYYNQIDPWTYIQVKRTFSTRNIAKIPIKLIKEYQGHKIGSVFEIEQENAQKFVNAGYAEYIGDVREEESIDGLFFEPVPNDIKAITVSDIQKVKDTLTRDTTKQMALIVGGIIILALIFVIGFYFMTQQ